MMRPPLLITGKNYDEATIINYKEFLKQREQDRTPSCFLFSDTKPFHFSHLYIGYIQILFIKFWGQFNISAWVKTEQFQDKVF
jgi:hypothetical protein